MGPRTGWLALRESKLWLCSCANRRVSSRAALNSCSASAMLPNLPVGRVASGAVLLLLRFTTRSLSAASLTASRVAGAWASDAFTIPRNAWTYIDDAFAQVSIWNVQNPTQAPKTIQFIVTPGFNSPPWMLNELTSCDGLFQTPAQTPPSTCGKVTFLGYQETADGSVFPLPWNSTYKSAWQTFLTALSARYLSNPAFVSMDWRTSADWG